MHRGIADADTPYLGIRAAGHQALGSDQSIFCQLEVSRVNIKGYDLAAIASFYLGAYALVVHGGATSGMLLFAISGLRFHHVVSAMGQDTPHSVQS